MKRVRLIKSALFLVILSNVLLTACSSATQPEIVLEASKIDLGEVVEGEVIERDVLIANEGNAALEVLSVSTSCGCTTTSIDSTTVQPGETVSLTIKYDSGAHDIDSDVSVHRQIFIASNDPNQSEVVIDLVANVSANSEN